MKDKSFTKKRAIASMEQAFQALSMVFPGAKDNWRQLLSNGLTEPEVALKFIESSASNARTAPILAGYLMREIMRMEEGEHGEVLEKVE